MIRRNVRGIRQIFICGFALLAVVLGFAVSGSTSELGHYAPAMPRNCDFIVPDPGFYYVQYIVHYTSDTLKDRNGDKIDTIQIGPVTINVETDVDSWSVECLEPTRSSPPRQALEAHTINAAFQFGMEEDVGSLEVGKFADFVVLDRNPLKVDPDEIRDIRVLVTVRGGKVTFSDIPEYDRINPPGGE